MSGCHSHKCKKGTEYINENQVCKKSIYIRCNNQYSKTVICKCSEFRLKSYEILQDLALVFYRKTLVNILDLNQQMYFVISLINL